MSNHKEKIFVRLHAPENHRCGIWYTKTPPVAGKVLIQLGSSGPWELHKIGSFDEITEAEFDAWLYGE